MEPREILVALRQEGDEGLSWQLGLLPQLCEDLGMVQSDRDLRQRFDPDQFLPVLCNLMNSPLEDIVLYTVRCLTHFLSLDRNCVGPVVELGACAALCRRLEHVDMSDGGATTDQCVKALEVITQSHTAAVASQRGLEVVFGFLGGFVDFFPVDVRRSALNVAANLCRTVSEEQLGFAVSHSALLRNQLLVEDSRQPSVAQLALHCISRLADHCSRSSDKALLRTLADDELIQTLLECLGKGGREGPGVAALLGRLSRLSPEITLKLVHAGLAETLVTVLESPDELAPASSATPSTLSPFSSALRLGLTVMQTLLGKGSGRYHSGQSTAFTGELDKVCGGGAWSLDRRGGEPEEPPIPVETPCGARSSAVEVWTCCGYCSNCSNGCHMGPASVGAGGPAAAVVDAGRADGPPAAALTHTESGEGACVAGAVLLRGLLPTLLRCCHASVFSQQRENLLAAIVQMVEVSDGALLEQTVSEWALPEFIACLLANPSEAALVRPALALTTSLLRKAPGSFTELLQRHGVLFAVASIARGGGELAGQAAAVQVLSPMSASTATAPSASAVALVDAAAALRAAAGALPQGDDASAPVGADGEDDDGMDMLCSQGSQADSPPAVTPSAAVELLAAAVAHPVSAFEVESSGILPALLSFMTHLPPTTTPRALHAALAARRSRIEALINGVGPAAPGQTAAWVGIVKWAHSVLDRVESLPLLIYDAPPSEVLTALLSPVTLRVERHRGDHVSGDCGGRPLMVEPLTLTEDVAAFLLPRVRLRWQDRPRKQLEFIKQAESTTTRRNVHHCTFTHTSDWDNKGVLHWIATDAGAQRWVNPMKAGLVVLSSSEGRRVWWPGPSGDDMAPDVFTSNCTCNPTPENPEVWFGLDLGLLLAPTAYTLRAGSPGTEGPSTWEFQGSADAAAWTTLDARSDETKLRMPYASATFPLASSEKAPARAGKGASPPVSYRYFRVVKKAVGRPASITSKLRGKGKGKDRDGQDSGSLSLSGLELYGRVLGACPTLMQVVPKRVLNSASAPPVSRQLSAAVRSAAASFASSLPSSSSSGAARSASEPAAASGAGGGGGASTGTSPPLPFDTAMSQPAGGGVVCPCCGSALGAGGAEQRQAADMRPACPVCSSSSRPLGAPTYGVTQLQIHHHAVSGDGGGVYLGLHSQVNDEDEDEEMYGDDIEDEEDEDILMNQQENVSGGLIVSHEDEDQCDEEEEDDGCGDDEDDEDDEEEELIPAIPQRAAVAEGQVAVEGGLEWPPRTVLRRDLASFVHSESNDCGGASAPPSSAPGSSVGGDNPATQGLDLFVRLHRGGREEQLKQGETLFHAVRRLQSLEPAPAAPAGQPGRGAGGSALWRSGRTTLTLSYRSTAALAKGKTPWTSEELQGGSVTKLLLVQHLQSVAPPSFLKAHGLRGQSHNVATKHNRQQLRKIYDLYYAPPVEPVQQPASSASDAMPDVTKDTREPLSMHESGEMWPALLPLDQLLTHLETPPSALEEPPPGSAPSPLPTAAVVVPVVAGTAMSVLAALCAVAAERPDGFAPPPASAFGSPVGAGADTAGGAVRGVSDLVVNAKLSAKLMRQLSDSLAQCSGVMPKWVHELPRLFPCLFPLDMRLHLLSISAGGVTRAVYNSLQTLRMSGGEGARARLPRLQVEKARVSRSALWEDACAVMRSHCACRSTLEVEFVGEEGTGTGPTTEFYSMLCRALQQRAHGVWVTDPPPDASVDGSAPRSMRLDADVDMIDADHDPGPASQGSAVDQDLKLEGSGAAAELVFTQCGLFPAPLSQERQRSPQVVGLFQTLGRLIAKALLDGRLLDLPVSPALVKLLQDRPLGLYDVVDVHPDVGRALEGYHATCIKRDAIAQDQSLTEAERQRQLAELARTECPAMLDFTFQVPGSDEQELCEGGSDVAVTLDNLHEYLRLAVKLVTQDGIAEQAAAMRQGFNQSFPIATLSPLSSELVQAIAGDRGEVWCETDLQYISPARGGRYEASSPPFQFLLEVLAGFNPAEQRLFLQFATGCPRLPPGGLKMLRPQLTVHCRESQSQDPDSAYPSVNTCQHFLRLPAYSSQAILYERLSLAMRCPLRFDQS